MSAVLINCIHHQEWSLYEDILNFRADKKLIYPISIPQSIFCEEDPNSSPFTGESVGKFSSAKNQFMNQ